MSSAKHTYAAVLKGCGCKRHGTLLLEGVTEFRAARPQTIASETREKGDRGRAAAGQSEINRPTVQWEGKVEKREQNAKKQPKEG